jgi:hypothetical protein
MNRRTAFFAAALALLGAAGWLMSRGDKPIKDQHPRVTFPHSQRDAERARNQRRLTLPPPPAASADEGPRPKRDPLLTALPPRSKTTVVFEASALKKSPVAKLLLDCMMSKHDMDELDKLKQDFGFNPMEDIDRFALSSEHAAIVSGDFSGLRWDKMDAKGQAYGVHGMLYGGEGQEAVAIWNKQILIWSADDGTLRQTIDRLEDRAPAGAPPIPDWAVYGDVYGMVAADDIAMMLPQGEQGLADRFRSALERVEIHVDASDDVAFTADATGPSPDDVTDLGKSLGAALSLGRLSAQAQGDDKLAELLDLARVSPREGGRFSFELALPMDVVRRQIGPCPRGREDRDEADASTRASP